MGRLTGNLAFCEGLSKSESNTPRREAKVGKNYLCFRRTMPFYLALIGLFFTSVSVFAQHTYYISKSAGSDSNTSTAAQSKATPWAHLPGMVSCAINCKSYTPVAGDSFILKGGDTWVASDLGDVWTWSGTSGAPIYIGVDKTWYSGGSWTRPIWTCGGAACSGTGNYANYWFPVGSYVTLDNIEFTGLYTNGTGGNPSYVAAQLDHEIVENCYFHGWTIASGATQDFGIIASFNHNSFSPYTSLGSGLFYSVIDGSDANQPSMEAIGGAPTYIVGNYIQNVSNELNSISTTNVHDNYFGPVLTSFQSGAHQNAAALGGSDNGQTYQFFYNNVITGSTCSVCGGVVKLWLDQYTASASDVGYAFNNVMYNNTPGNLIDQGHGTAGATYWTWNFFNNTVECGTDSNTGACYDATAAATGSSATFNSLNNHWISSGAGTGVSCGTGKYTCTSTNDLLQTVATAKGQGYSSTSTYAFQPTGTSGSTMGAGTNISSMCSTISELDSAAGTACASATGYACAYNTANHTVSCPALTLGARPASAAWDIGAYQTVGSIQPASGLKATPH